MTLKSTIAATAVLALLMALVQPVAATPPPGVVPSYCRQTATGYRCMIGPFDVPAGGRVEMVTGVAAPSEAGYITSGDAKLVDRAGEPVSHHMVHLHHSVWLNPHARDMTCESYDGGLFPGYERFFARSKDTPKLQVPNGYGYFWDPGLSQPHTESAPGWGFVVHLDGEHGAAEVYIQVDFGFIPETTAGHITPVRGIWLDVRNCRSEPEYNIRKGSGRNGVHVERWTYVMPQSGRFVFLAGHLHDGGLKISLKNLRTEQLLFTSRATYGLPRDPWYLTKMSSWMGAPGIRVEAGDELEVSAYYDSTQGRRGVMGIIGGAFVPDH